jgi:hypothetical protein
LRPAVSIPQRQRCTVDADPFRSGDACTNPPVLKGHDVRTAAQQGWDTLKNGELLNAAEEAGFEIFLTPDKNMRFQQNLAGRKIAVVAIGNPQWPVLRLHVELVVAAVNAVTPGSYTEVRCLPCAEKTETPPGLLP